MWLCVIPAVLFCAIIGILSDQLAYKPLRNSPRISALITAIGVSLFLENASLLVFGSDPRSFPKVFSGSTVQLGGLNISVAAVITIIVSVIVMCGLFAFIHKTKVGKGDAGSLSGSFCSGANGNQYQSHHFHYFCHWFCSGGFGGSAVLCFLSAGRAVYGNDAGIKSICGSRIGRNRQYSRRYGGRCTAGRGGKP